ncbi:hypothetical protein COF68_05735 [Bacillus toyonensis]|uniref:hypothetical protein n=1 Tax=Bacillus toyonensis TaxID=155322 RepID=UPI000BFBA1F2|nr:hypothetical protein [Bacillus toyonensis]PHE64341.1 hypothetical protein COF68_05735 [Bacillus toyonensis]
MGLGHTIVKENQEIKEKTMKISDMKEGWDYKITYSSGSDQTILKAERKGDWVKVNWSGNREGHIITHAFKYYDFTLHLVEIGSIEMDGDTEEELEYLSMEDLVLINEFVYSKATEHKEIPEQYRGMVKLIKK